DRNELRRKLSRRVGNGGEQRLEIPIATRSEGASLTLALHEESDGHRLHPTRGESGSDFLPEERRHGVANEAVEYPSGLLSPNEVLIDLTRLPQRFGDRFGGDLVEDDPRNGNLGRENLQEVPPDALPL